MFLIFEMAAEQGFRSQDQPDEEGNCNLVESYRDSAPKLAGWLEDSSPEGLAVFALPEAHRERLRTSNPIERSIQQEM